MMTTEHAGMDDGHPAAANNKVSSASVATPVEGLTLGPGLVLPVEAVTETFAILAKRGAGKTYTADGGGDDGRRSSGGHHRPGRSVVGTA